MLGGGPADPPDGESSPRPASEPGPPSAFATPGVGASLSLGPGPPSTSTTGPVLRSAGLRARSLLEVRCLFALRSSGGGLGLADPGRSIDPELAGPAPPGWAVPQPPAPGRPWVARPWHTAAAGPEDGGPVTGSRAGAALGSRTGGAVGACGAGRSGPHRLGGRLRKDGRTAAGRRGGLELSPSLDPASSGGSDPGGSGGSGRSGGRRPVRGVGSVVRSTHAPSCGPPGGRRAQPIGAGALPRRLSTTWTGPIPPAAAEG